MKDTTEPTYLIGFETTYRVGFADCVKDVNNVLYTKLGEYVREIAMFYESDYELGKEAIKLFRAFLQAMNRQHFGDLG